MSTIVRFTAALFAACCMFAVSVSATTIPDGTYCMWGISASTITGGTFYSDNVACVGMTGTITPNNGGSNTVNITGVGSGTACPAIGTMVAMQWDSVNNRVVTTVGSGDFYSTPCTAGGGVIEDGLYCAADAGIANISSNGAAVSLITTACTHTTGRNFFSGSTTGMTIMTEVGTGTGCLYVGALTNFSDMTATSFTVHVGAELAYTKCASGATSVAISAILILLLIVSASF